MTTLGDIAVRDGIQTGPFGSQLHAEDYVSRGVGVVMPQDLGDNEIVGTRMARITSGRADTLAKHHLRPSDIVFSRRGDVTRRALVKPTDEPVICGTGCLRVRVDADRANPRCVSYAMGTPEAKAWLVRHAVGATMANLNTKILSALPLRLPERPVQNAIVEVLGALDDKIAANRRVQETARQLAITVVGRHVDSCVVEDIASISRGTVSPERMTDEGVTHFSLPSFDRGFAAVEVPTEIKSSKHALDGPVVLVSKLNPRIPRIWPVDVLPAGQSVASTEFVPLAPRENLAVGELWAALAAPAFSTKLLAHVAGTTGSHQRVRPNDLLSVPIADVRSMPNDARELVRKLCRLVNERTHEYRQLATTRDELLPLLMSGRITIKDAERRVEEEV